MARGTRQEESVEELCRLAAKLAGFDPDERVERQGNKPWPRWCEYRQDVQNKLAHEKSIAAAVALEPAAQAAQYANAPLVVFGEHEDSTLLQMRNCLSIGNTVAGVICADGHLGYAQPVGGVIAYEDQISISGVGFDIGCGNMAVELDVTYGSIKDRVPQILSDIRKYVSFGVGRVNDERVHHDLFDDNIAWLAADMEDYKNKARAQLGTVGSGNHYVDLMIDTTPIDNPEFGGTYEDCRVWIGVHFGSRGLGHTSATKYLKAAGGRDGMHVPPAVVDVDSEIGTRYVAAMNLAGRYAYAGREWVVDRVRQLTGGSVLQSIHNHHNYAWQEQHNDKMLWVVRKGATPAFPGQKGFIGGSMGDDAVIVEGVDSSASKSALYSTIHGAGRLFSRSAAKRAFSRSQMDEWLKSRNVLVSGGDVDESPMAYRRLPEVLAHHDGTVRVLHTLRPFAVAMAGNDEFDPFKD